MTGKDILDSEIKYLKGVGPMRAEAFKSDFGISTFRDLLSHYPFRYIDRTQFHKISEIEINNTSVQLKGKITKIEKQGKGRANRLTALLSDGTGTVQLVWFQSVKWVSANLFLNQEYLVFGKPAMFGRMVNITHPEFEKVEAGYELSSRLQAVYSSSDKLSSLGLHSRNISRLLENLLPKVSAVLYENLPKSIIQKYKLISHRDAVLNIHQPSSYVDIQKAQFRLKYEEFLFIQLQLIEQNIIRKEKVSGYVFQNVGESFNTFYSQNLPFELTGAQKKVIREIRKDFRTGKQMNRLLQGDVGSGKTLVALMCMLIAVDNGYQCALMAPTEILAQQHYYSISKFLDGIDVKIELLTGSSRSAKRRELLANLESGKLDILIGTHALIEPKVVFHNLGFVVIDEQHRFGVQQRAKLWEKGRTNLPHVLVMTATPIPRTMAMTLYGDLDYSVIDELPPGRKAIETYHYSDSKRLALFGFMKRQIALGRQIYVVYPLIKESETLDLKDLNDGYNSISRAFPKPEYQISVVHGQMKAQDKEYEMQRFKRGETQIMVATTVIEVGVDVPNASVMVIENAERFGLSQLHQLRGRVGRGAEQSFCILMSSYKLSNEAKTRLNAMVESSDGFEIAEIDLKLRGPGDLQGTQQSGILAMKIADIVKDEKLLHYARNDAQEILAGDPKLEKEENKNLKKYLLQNAKDKTKWGLIS
jgi:ATP-dependent DNA helicase RecG